MKTVSRRSWLLTLVWPVAPGRLAVMLGGRAAEELELPTTGAESDLKQASNLARRMVGLWGMSAALGPVSYGIGETHPFLGRELARPREYAEATAAELDRAVRSVIDDAYRRALATLQTCRDLLDIVAHELITHETVDGTQLDAILPGGHEVARGCPDTKPGIEREATSATPAEAAKLAVHTDGHTR